MRSASQGIAFTGYNTRQSAMEFLVCQQLSDGTESAGSEWAGAFRRLLFCRLHRSAMLWTPCRVWYCL